MPLTRAISDRVRPGTRASRAAGKRTCPAPWAALALVLLGSGALNPWLVGHTYAASAPAPIPAEKRVLEEMAAKGTNVTRLYQLGDICHDVGVAGDKKAVERAEAYLRQLLALEPTNAPAIALLGSVYTMKGRDAFWPNVQLRLVREGNDFMDQALRLDPENLRARITRAFNNAHMPEFLGRTEIVRADLAWLSAKAERQPECFTIPERQEIALHLGRQLKHQHRIDDARAAWKQGCALAPDSKLGSEISTELARLR